MTYRTAAPGESSGAALPAFRTRTDEVINVAGHRLSTGAMEEVLAAHGEIVGEVVRMVRERIGPVAAFKIATVIKRLPKMRSGKILRGTMRSIADGREYKAPPTLDDPEILPEIAAAPRRIERRPDPE